MQRSLYFYRKRTGNFLPAKYARSAAMREMPFKKSGDRRKRAEQI
jgi:hypothetical protein